jgi:hypothetical protein
MQTAVPLLGGNYTSRSLIAGAQRCVNLYAEANQKDAPFPYTNYPRPGLRFEGGVPVPVITAGSRCMYRSSTGSLFEVIDDKVYVTTFVGVRNLLGTINSGLGLVSMQDNGTVIVIVDGSSSGWVVNLGTLAFSAIVDPAFYGANRVAYLDGFLIFNRPNTTQVYLSPLFWDGVTPFDALDIADKIGTPDTIQALW